MTTPKRNARVLHDLTVSEISSVDRGAGEGCRVVLAKRDDRNAAFRHLMDRIFEVQKRQPFNPPWEKNLDVVADPDGPINPGGAKEPLFPPDDDDDEAARLAAEMDTDNDDDETDDEEERQMKRAEEASALGKRYGITAICKRIVEKNDLPLSEHELTQMISDHAARSDISFSKLFCAQTEEGTLLRRAVEATKHRAWIGASGMR